MTKLPAPDLATDQGTLRSKEFDDIYFSPDDGLAETEHVFIAGNDLPHRLAQQSPNRRFVIGELGFGTGLNILAACKAHEEHGSGPLDLWTVEGFPLSREAFAETQSTIAQRWPNLAPWTERLVATYPEPIPGQVQVALSSDIRLTIAFGEVQACLALANFQADAWFLDGFAPSRNPEMWSGEVLAEVARLTKPGGTAATFTVASAVRASLEAAGFSWEKAPGFGRKKHMLRAAIDAPSPQVSATPWFRSPSRAEDGTIAIIGAGIAGAAAAQALRERGRSVTVFGTGSRDQAASSNPAGLVMPRLDADDTPAARFYRDAFLFALGLYEDLQDEAFGQVGGSLAMEEPRFSQVQKIGLWPEGFLTFSDDQVHVAKAGVLRPRLAADCMLEGTNLVADDIEAIKHEDAAWFVTTVAEQKRRGPFAAVVLATGASQPFWPGAPVTPSLGQIDLFKGGAPSTVITDGHYVAPYGEDLLTGATYARFEGGPVETSEESTKDNSRAAAQLLGHEPGEPIAARAALRATTPDRHPIAGPLYDEAAAIAAYAGLRTGLKQDYPVPPYRDGLYVLSGLGSRGLVTAPILGAHIAAQITGGVSPLTSDVSAMVHPGRFLIRDLKRGKISP